MPFNDTITRGGIIQAIEFWSDLGSGVISGDPELLKEFTARVNSALDTLVPILLARSATNVRWDDSNHTDQPIASFDVVQDQGAYRLLKDETSLDILKIKSVKILQNNEYKSLRRVYLDTDEAEEIMTNTSKKGAPTSYLIKGNIIYVYPIPDQSIFNGFQAVFERQPSYFSDTDTTKKPGIPRQFHELLALYPALDYLLVKRPDNVNLIQEIKNRIMRKEAELGIASEQRNLTKRSITVNQERYD